MKRPLDGSLTPRGLSRVQAAYYVGVSTSLFDQMVADGRMPPPREINSRRVYDRHQVDAAFDELPGGADSVRTGAQRVGRTASRVRNRELDEQEHETALAELTELSKTPGPLVLYRSRMLDREALRLTVMSKPMGKRERAALLDLYGRQPATSFGAMTCGRTTSIELEARGFAEIVREGGYVTWRITAAGIAAIEAGLAQEPMPKRETPPEDL